MTIGQWTVAITLIVVCVVVSVAYAYLSKRPSRQLADTQPPNKPSDTQAQQNLQDAVQRDAAWKARPRQHGNSWNSRPRTPTQESGPGLNHMGAAAVIIEDTTPTPPHRGDDSPGGSDGCGNTPSGDVPSGGSGE
jgi:hypothetical protein